MSDANKIKNNFGKRYIKPITPFKAWWSGGVGTHDMPKSHIAEDAAWADAGAARYAAMDVAWSAAWHAADAAARDAADAVRAAAQQEMRSRQEVELRRICVEVGG